MTHPSDIYHLRNANLDPKLALKLSDIISSYRPHDPIPTREELGDPLPIEPPVGLKNIAEDCGIDYNKFKAKCKKQI